MPNISKKFSYETMLKLNSLNRHNDITQNIIKKTFRISVGSCLKSLALIRG